MSSVSTFDLNFFLWATQVLSLYPNFDLGTVVGL